MFDYPVVDAHLDLAYNVMAGRDLNLSATEIREAEKREDKQCMVTFPEIRRGGLTVVFGSTFVSPTEFPETTDHPFDSEMARKAKEEIDIYQSWEADGLARIIRSRSSLEQHLEAWGQDGIFGLIIAMESADPIRSPDELEWWFDAGVRVIGPAWGPTRYCGGFAGGRGQATGFTPMGRELLAGMKDLGIVLDLAHMSVESFWEGVESDLPSVCCTHTTPRELIGVERLPDAVMMKALAERGGVVGLGLGNVFVDATWWGEGTREPVALDSVAKVFELMARSTGWDHLGLGSDLDGGIGVDESPEGLDTIADIRKVGDVLDPEVAQGVMGSNWLKFLGRALPSA